MLASRVVQFLLIISDPLGVTRLSFSHKAMIQLGDLNLAGFFPLGSDNNDKNCDDTVKINFLVAAEAMVYAITDINKRSDLLPNITLGYVIMDDCGKESTAVGHALHLNPLLSKVNASCIDNSSFSFYDVVGIVGGIPSDVSVAIAQLANVFQIPQISPTSTSDVLSDSVRYPYFMRVMPPDIHQAEAIIQLISFFNWTYISTFNEDSLYGRNAIYQVKKIAKRKGICVAFSPEVSSLTAAIEYEQIAKTLRKKKARVVVVFAFTISYITKLLTILENTGGYGEFIWIFSDSYSVRERSNVQYNKVLRNAFFMEIHNKHDVSFERYIANISPVLRRNNDWLKQYWKEYHSCSWTDTENGTSCLRYSGLPKNAITHRPSFVIDSVYAFAHGLHQYLHNFCRNETSLRGSAVRRCISGPELFKTIKDLSFQGVHDFVQFDSKGDGIGTYNVNHYTGNFSENNAWYSKVASWSLGDETITMEHPLIQWVTEESGQFQISLVVPESVCSKPCNPGQFIIPKELSCCWECRNCRSNEIVTENATGCLECPDYTWPDQKTFEKCVNIEPYYIHWGDALSILTIFFTIIGLLATCTIAGIFHKNKDERLVKASGRELNSIIFAGTIGAYSTVFFLLAKPCPVVCQLGRAGINIVFSVEYAALFAKTNRIFRIFHAGRRGTKRPAFISSMAQLVLSLSLIGVQVRIQ